MSTKKLISVLSGLAAVLAPFSAMAQWAHVTLGSRAAEVRAQLGEPSQDMGTVMRYEPCEGSEEGTAKWSFVFVPPMPDADEAELAKGGKLTLIQRSVCGAERLDQATVDDEMATMIPVDATFVREFLAEDGRKAKEYLSATLATMFAAEDFVTCDAEGRVQPIASGTFSCVQSEDGLSWLIALGTCL